MSHEDIIMVLLFLIYIGWAGATILFIGMIKDQKTIKEFYEYAKKLEGRIRSYEGVPR